MDETKQALELLESLANTRRLLANYNSEVFENWDIEIVEFLNYLDDYVMSENRLNKLENEIYIQHYWNGDNLEEIANRVGKSYSYIRCVASNIPKKLAISKFEVECAADDTKIKEE